MISQMNKTNSCYVLVNEIYKNTYKDIWLKFIKEKKLEKEYSSKKTEYMDYRSFINYEIQAGVITVDEINNILEDALTFGKHRVIQIYDIDVFDMYEPEELVNALLNKYSEVTYNYNELAVMYEPNDEKDLDGLAYFKILDVTSDNKVNYMRTIMVKKVPYNMESGHVKYENSYFPIDIDFKNKKLLVKYYDKEYIKGNERGEVLANSYVSTIISLLERIELAATKQKQYQSALYRICDDILNQVINEKSKIMLNDMDTIVANTSSILRQGLKSSMDVDLLLEKYGKNIFDINEQVNKLIENICISKIIYEANDESELTSIDGLISYITYKEQGQVRTTIRNRKKKENLLDSQSYLNLRSALDEAKNIEVIKMMWNRIINGKVKQLSIKYDASRFEYLSIKIYLKYTEEELDYARQKLQYFC